MVRAVGAEQSTLVFHRLHQPRVGLERSEVLQRNANQCHGDNRTEEKWISSVFFSIFISNFPATPQQVRER